MTEKPQMEKVSKHTLTLADGVYAAVLKSAELVLLDPMDFIRDLVVERVIADGTLDEATTKQVQAYRWLVAEAVASAKQVCKAGNFSPSLTADVFAGLSKRKDWADQYEFYIQDNMFKSGNPRKGPINREIGYRIRAAIGAVVEKDEAGATVMKKVTGNVIQSYTPFVSFDPATL